jgi:hypothetical protein
MAMILVRDQGMTYRNTSHERTHLMLMTLAIVLIILWLLGLVTSSTMGGLIHILLVVAVIILLVRVIQGRRVL